MTNSREPQGIINLKIVDKWHLKTWIKIKKVFLVKK